ncbi:MAG: aminotransferase, partial [Clostridia bacterium]|nr:aminotransferase [Clostridia bacterium]
KNIWGMQTIGYDKINQLRHIQFLKDRDGVLALMKKHAAILKPKFDAVLEKLDSDIAPLGIASWHRPKGGYFVSLDTLPGCAKRTHALCKEAGVVLTGAGATWPGGKDPKDSNLRIAPSFPSVEELKQAISVFCICLKLAALEKLLAE